MRGTIAQRTVALDGFDGWSHEAAFAPFAVPSADGEADWCMTVRVQTHLDRPEGTPQGRGKRTAWIVDDDGNGALYHTRGAFVLRFDAAFSRCLLTLHADVPDADVLRYVYTAQCFAYHMLTQQGCCVHSAALEKDGHAILLVGPSGIGKSTLATACQTVDPSVRVLCEDLPAVRFEDGTPMVYGTPFCGNDTRVADGAARLDAIVLLSQASGNRLTVADHSAPATLMEAIPYPVWSRPLTDAAIARMQSLYDTVAICRFESDGTTAAGERLLAAWRADFKEEGSPSHEN